MANRTASLFLVVFLVAACSGSAQDTTTTTTAAPATTTASTTLPTTPPDTGAFPMTVSSGGVTTTLDHVPESIVSLSPTATETLFAVGAGDQVAAVDDQSTYPAEAPTTALSGFTPNVEAIAAYEPDLVIVSNDIDGIVASLQGIGVPVLVLPAPAELSDAYDEVRLVGTVTGHPDEGDQTATEMESDIEALLAGVQPSDPPRTFYDELGSDGGGSYYSATSATFIGKVFDAFGLVNIADEADSDGSGYPLMSGEFILGANPDLIFYTSCCGDTPASIGDRPGWSDLTAVQNGSLFEVNDDLASRWGPRLPQFFELVAGAIQSLSK